MADGQLNVVVAVEAKLDDVLGQVKKLQSAFKNIKLTDNLKTQFDKSFSNIESKAKNLKDILNGGINTQTQVSRVKEYYSSISKEYDNIIKSMKQITPDMLKIDFKNNGEFQKLTKEIEEAEKSLQNLKNTSTKLEFNIDSLQKGSKSPFVKYIEQVNEIAASSVNAKEKLAAFQKVLNTLEARNNALKSRSKSGDGYTDQTGFKAVTEYITQLQKGTEEEQKFGQQLENLTSQMSTFKAEAQQSGLNEMNSSAQNTAASMKELGQSLTDAANQSLSFNNTMREITSMASRFFSVTAQINLMKRALKETVSVVKELDASMTETAVVTEYTVSDMWAKLPEYTARAQKLGVEINDTYQAATLYYQQGLDSEAVEGVSEETLKLARISGLEAAQATDAMTAALRGFNMEVNQVNAQKVNDVFSNLAANSASNVEELSTAMEKVASIANSAGMSFENTSAFLAQIIETTRESAETAGTALKTVIARFSEVKKLYSEGQLTGSDEEGSEIDVNKIDTALKTAGIDMHDYFLGKTGLDTIFTELASKWDGLTKVQQRYIATQAAGSRQQSRFIALMSDYSRTQELVGFATDSAGASEEQFQKTLEGLDAKLNQLSDAWQTFLMGIANSEIIKSAVDALTSLLNIVNSIIDKLSGGSGIFKSLLGLGIMLGSLRMGSKLFTGMLGGVGGALTGQATFAEGFGAAWAKKSFLSTAVASLFNKRLGGITKDAIEEGTIEAGKDLASNTQAISGFSKFFGLSNAEALYQKRFKSAEATSAFTRGFGKSYNAGEGVEAGKKAQHEYAIKIQEQTAQINAGFLAATLAAKGLSVVFDKIGNKDLSDYFNNLSASLGTATSGFMLLSRVAPNAMASLVGSLGLGGMAGIGVAIAALTALYTAYKKSTYKYKNEQYENEKSNYDSLKSELEELNSQVNEKISSIEDIADKYDLEIDTEIDETNLDSVIDKIESAPKLTLADKEQLKTLEKETKQLQRQEEIKKNAEKAQASIAADAAKVAMGASYQNTDYSDVLSGIRKRQGYTTTYEGYKGGQIEYNSPLKYSQVAQTIISDLDQLNAKKEELLDSGADQEAINNVEKLINEDLALMSDFYTDAAEKREIFVAAGRTDMVNEIDNSLQYIENYGKTSSQKISSFFGGSAIYDNLVKSLSETYDSAEDCVDALEEMGISWESIGADSKEDLIQWFKDYKNSVDEATDSINEFSNVAQRAHTSISDLQNALDSDNQDSDWETASKAYKAAAELVKAEKFGTDDYQKFVEFMTGYGYNSGDLGKDANWYKGNWANASKVADKFFNSEDQTKSMINMQDALLNSGLIKDMGNGMVDVTKEFTNSSQAAEAMSKALGGVPVSIEAAEAAMKGLEAYGYDFSEVTNLTDQYNEYKDYIDSIQNLYDSLDGESLLKKQLKSLLEESNEVYNQVTNDLEALSEEAIIRLKFEYDRAQLLQEAEEAKQIAETTKSKTSRESAINAAAAALVDTKTEAGITNEVIESNAALKSAATNLEAATDKYNQALESGTAEDQEKAFNDLMNAYDTYEARIEGFVDKMDEAGIAIGTYTDHLEEITNTTISEKSIKTDLNNKGYTVYSQKGGVTSRDYGEYGEQLGQLGQGGSVILSFRPVIDTQVLNDAGYEAGEGFATVFTHTFSNEAGDIAANFTPILPDGSVLEEGQFTQYCEDVLNGAEDTLDLKIGSNFEGEDAIAQAEAAAESIHEIYEQADLNKSINFSAQLDDGSLAQVKGFKDEEGVIHYSVEMDSGEKAELQEITQQDGSITYQTVLEDGSLLSLDAETQQINLDKAPAEETIKQLQNSLDGIKQSNVPTIDVSTSSATAKLAALQAKINAVKASANEKGTGGVHGTAHINGSAYANGSTQLQDSWKTKKTQSALVGELGQEMIVHGDQWWTVGDQGPEFTSIPAGSIVFNHKQTKDLLEKGYTDKRGKAFASGTAYKSGLLIGSGKSSSNTGKASASSSGSSSSSKSSDDKPWENKIDKLYNLLEQIDEALAQREKLERDYDRILKDRNRAVNELYKNAEKRIKQIEDEIKLQEQLASGRADQLKNIGSETWMDDDGNKHTYDSLGMGAYASYDFDNQVIKIDWEKINAVTNKDTGDQITQYLDRLEELSKSYEETQKTIEDMYDEIQEIKELGKSEYISYEQKLYDALVTQQQNVIDNMSELNDTMKDSNSNIIDSLKEQIDLERQIRDNTEKEEDIAEKERRLAYLRRDTSGANATEIKKLEDELEKARQDYEDDLIDQTINNLKDANDKASEQRERQIDIMQGQLDWMEKTGGFWDKVYSLISDSVDSTDELLENSELIDLLKDIDNYAGMSEIGQQNWLDQLETDSKEALLGLKNWRKDLLEQMQLDEGAVVKINGVDVKYDSSSGQWKSNSKIYDDISWSVSDSAYTAGSVKDIVKKTTQTTAAATTNTSSSSSSAKKAEDHNNSDYWKGIAIAIWAGNNAGGWGNDPERSNKLKSKGINASAVQGWVNSMAGLAQNHDAAWLMKHYGVPGSWSQYKYNAFATGGLADYTGPAWLDGTKSNPELVLNSQDTKNFIKLKDILASILTGETSGDSLGGDAYFEFNINVDSIGSDYDVDQMIDRISKRLYDNSKYRNVNAINLLR